MKNSDEAKKKRLTSEDIVILVVIGLGFLGSVLLWRWEMPPIMVSVFLATGLASLVYRFLGGLRSTKLNTGAFKVTGAAAFLITSALFINGYLSKHICSGAAEGFNRLELVEDGDRFKVIASERPGVILGSLSISTLKECGLFNSFNGKLERFIVTERLPSKASNIDLDPLPFRISTGEYGSEYSRYSLVDKEGKVLYSGAIYRRQAEIVKIGDNFYLVAVTEVNHTPFLGRKPYAKFAIGEIVTRMEFGVAK